MQWAVPVVLIFVKIIVACHESMYLLDLQVDPYAAVLDGGQQIDVEPHHREIMADPYRISVDQII
jgi:hypothetical protein